MRDFQVYEIKQSVFENNDREADKLRAEAESIRKQKNDVAAKGKAALVNQNGARPLMASVLAPFLC